jgi:D-alanyl-D-alanine carboxypeptidase
MKRFFAYFSLIIFLSIILTGAFLYYFGSGETRISHSLAPIPDFLTLTKNSQVRLLDLWFPSTDQAHGSGFDITQLTAKSVLMYDLTTNKIIFEKNVKEKLPMASLTKIMTAIIALENKREEDRYVVRKENIVGEDSMGVSEGEVLRFEDLLYGLMLPSGNE